MVSELLVRSAVSIRALNVGGGFPAKYLGTNVPPLKDYMRHIENGLESQNFSQEVEIFCEPGRGLVADGMSVVARVQLRKKNACILTMVFLDTFLRLIFTIL